MMDERKVILFIVIVMAIIMTVIAIWLGARAHKESQARKARYKKAKAFTKKVIDEQVEYINSLHAIDEVTIMAFETIIEELAKHRL